MWDCTEALKKAAELIPDTADGALITSAVSRQYLLHFPSTAGILLLTRENACFFVDSRYTEKAQKTFLGCEIIKLTSASRQIGEFLDKLKIGTLCVETSFLTLREFSSYQRLFPGVRLDSSDEFDNGLMKLRSVKADEEIRSMRFAQKITDAAFEKICGFIEPGVTEKQIAARLEYEMKLLGADGLAFETIVVSGPNSSMPHGTPSDRAVESGDFITMDFGAMLGGYMSDMTRTVAVASVSDEQRRVYETVLEAQRRALDKIAPGKICREIDAVARNYIAEQGYDGYFGHGLGHSLGVEIHESPAFNTRDETVLVPGMVLSVEPGIYLPGRFGVRIEDVMIVTEDGCEDLTQSPKELLIL